MQLCASVCFCFVAGVKVVVGGYKGTKLSNIRLQQHHPYIACTRMHASSRHYPSSAVEREKCKHNVCPTVPNAMDVNGKPANRITILSAQVHFSNFHSYRTVVVFWEVVAVKKKQITNPTEEQMDCCAGLRSLTSSQFTAFTSLRHCASRVFFAIDCKL